MYKRPGIATCGSNGVSNSNFTIEGTDYHISDYFMETHTPTGVSGTLEISGSPYHGLAKIKMHPTTAAVSGNDNWFFFDINQ
jgi:hypothetical protein